MGYSGDYSLFTRSFSEFASTLTFVFFMGCMLANKLLPNTKASDFSFGWVSFAIGLIVYAPIQFFGHISAYYNPAATLGGAIVGDIDWMDFPFLVLAQLIGAFLGNVFVWIFYLPQFQTDPEPGPPADDDRLLRTRDDISPEALNFVSYNTRPASAVPAAGAGFREFGRMLSAARSEPSPEVEQLRVFSVSTQGSRRPGRSLRKSVSVSYTESGLQVVDVNTSLRRRRRSRTPSGVQENGAPSNYLTVDVDAMLNSRRRSNANSVELSPVLEDVSARMDISNLANDSAREMQETSTNRPNEPPPLPHVSSNDEKEEITKEEVEEDRLDPKFVASHIADQQIKLSIFCTRPPRYFPISNLITEIFATFYLVAGILWISDRSDYLYDGYDDLYNHGIFPFLVGIFSAVLVFCFGGMGAAMNPARDLVGRFSHWVLPIDGKGASEWYYAWITIVGPLIGGALGGVAFLVTDKLNKGDKDGVLG